MKLKRYQIATLVFALGAGIALVVNHLAFPNIRICKMLKPGISQSELVAALGQPCSAKPDGRFLKLSFMSHPVAAGLIKARIDTSSGRVVMLKCSEDGLPLWDKE